MKKIKSIRVNGFLYFCHFVHFVRTWMQINGTTKQIEAAGKLWTWIGDGVCARARGRRDLVRVVKLTNRATKDGVPIISFLLCYLLGLQG